MQKEIWEIRILLKTPTFSTPSTFLGSKKIRDVLAMILYFVIQMQLSRTSNIKLHKDLHYGGFLLMKSVSWQINWD